MSEQVPADQTTPQPGDAAFRARWARWKGFDAALEIGTAIVLSVTALVTSWAGYQASLWDGEQAAHYTNANAKHMAAARQATRAGQLQALDVMAFAEWANAYASGNTRLQAFYEARFRPEFRTAFEAWRASKSLRNPDAPPTPFVDPVYRRAAEVEADATESEAVRLFQQGQRANSISDHYVQGSVVLASALFFGGMCQVFRTPKVRMALLAVAVIAVVLGMFRIFTLPAMKL
jgi:hypothetical protein